MKIEYIKIIDLKSYERNARIHPVKQVNLLANSTANK